MSDSEFKQAFEAGRQAVRFSPDGQFIVLRDDEHVRVIEGLLEPYQPNPPRKTGNVRFDRTASFIDYVSEHKVEGTAIFADQRNAQIIAVLDHHGTKPGWCQHTAMLKLQIDPSWNRWLAINRNTMPQEHFVDFLETNRLDIAEPASGDLIDICTDLRGKSGVDWGSGVDLKNGSVQLRYQETLEAASATKGDITVPSRLTLGLAVYRGQDRFNVGASLRWRIKQAQLFFIVVLDQPDDVIDAAMASEMSVIAEQLGLPVLYGAPKI